LLSLFIHLLRFLSYLLGDGGEFVFSVSYCFEQSAVMALELFSGFKAVS